MNRRVIAALVAATMAVAAGCSDDGTFDRVLPADATSVVPPGAPEPPAGTTPSPTTAPDSVGIAGAPGAGDPYFPGLGNGGYDVERYDLVLDVDGPDLVASATLDITATADLDTFNLDFAGLDIDRLLVDGRPADHRVEGAELTVDPDPVLADGQAFTVTVDYHGRPLPLSDPVLGRKGWQTAGAITFVASEPDGAHSWFPGNDHPSDKAAFHFEITVPDDAVAIASGLLVSRESAGGRTTWIWDHPDAMPTYGATVGIGPLVLVESEGPHGIAVRHAFAPGLADVATAAFADTPTTIAELEAILGPYPFDAYGALVVDAPLGFALENQTFSLFDGSIVDGSFQSSRIMVHELAHHWFGNWVSPASWQETWLNEGFATYVEELWLEHTIAGYDIDRAMRELAQRPWDPIGDPGAAGMFDREVYARGALTLHALRRTMGDAGFFQLLHAWTDRFGGADASSADFAALASEVAGTDLGPFLDEWLNAPLMPALPA